MKKLLFILAIAGSISACDEWESQDFGYEPVCERIPTERNDNRFVKGYYGYGYSSQRYSHLDYIAQEYDGSGKELGTHLEDYADDYCFYE